MLIDSAIIKSYLLEELTKARQVLNRPGLRLPVKNKYDSLASVLENLIIIITTAEKEGDTTMDGFKIKIAKIVDESADRARGGEIETLVKELVPQIPKGQKALLDVPSDFKYVSFANRVVMMRKTNQIPQNFTTSKTKTGVYLVHKKEPVASRHRGK